VHRFQTLRHPIKNKPLQQGSGEHGAVVPAHGAHERAGAGRRREVRGDGAAAAGGAFHSSTSHLSGTRMWLQVPHNTHDIPTKWLRLSWNVDKCKPLASGGGGAQRQELRAERHAHRRRGQRAPHRWGITSSLYARSVPLYPQWMRAGSCPVDGGRVCPFGVPSRFVTLPH